MLQGVNVDIVMLVRYGTPIILLGLIISNVRLNVVVGTLIDSMKDMKKHAVWTDRYDERTDNVDGRLDRLESRINGKT